MDTQRFEDANVPTQGYNNSRSGLWPTWPVLALTALASALHQCTERDDAHRFLPRKQPHLNPARSGDASPPSGATVPLRDWPDSLSTYMPERPAFSVPTPGHAEPLPGALSNAEARRYG